MLRRGIGVHHSGLNRKYRVAVETLFRMKKVTVVVCTASLAYGLNMPCKTVVIAGDSFYLNAMLYQQMSGRAGRRGFDNRGDVIFYGIPPAKVRRLLLSPLPDLQVNLPITCSSLLRIIIKASVVGREHWQAIAKGLRRLITCNMYSLRGRDNFFPHAIWFSTLFLRHRHFLFNNGAPTDLSGFVAHLHWTEPANFAFVTLLRSGSLGEIVRSGRDDAETSGAAIAAATALMTVLARLFFPVVLPRRTAQKQSKLSRRSPSELVLKSLPESAARVLQQEKRTLVNEAVRYFLCYLRLQQRFESCDEALFPLSSLKGVVPNVKVSVDYSISTGWLTSVRLPAPILLAPYEALSGHTDHSISTISQLVLKTIHTLRIHPLLLPAWTADADLKLDSYAVDAVRHGQVKTLRRDHTLDDYSLWEHLKNWESVLKALLACHATKD